MQRMAWTVVLLIATLAAAGGPVRAQVTGAATLNGRVVDQTGEGLPGVEVLIRSAGQPEGNRVARTGPAGDYRIALPPASDYVLLIDHEGFVPVEVGPLDLDPGKTTRQDVTLIPGRGMTETVVVESRGRIIDTESAKTATTYNAEFIEGLPIIGSNYQDILKLAPGVTDTDGDGNPNVHGARDTGLQYRLDGGNITDPVSGTFGQNLNADIISEIEIITSGASAEFGRADGGFANIITKSGGNDFEGKFEIRYQGRIFNGDGADTNDVNDFDVDLPDYNDLRAALSLGGAILKDRLWYFGSLQILDREVPSFQVGNPRIRSARGHYGFAKLTWQVDSDDRLAFQVNSDPIRFDGNNIALGTSIESDYSFSQGGLTPQIKWTSTISPQLLLEAQATRFDTGIAITPLSEFFTPTPVTRVQTGANVVQARYPCEAINCSPRHGERRIYQVDIVEGSIHGPWFIDSGDRRRRSAIKTDLSLSLEDAWGQHTVKSGIEFADETFSDDVVTNPVLVDATTPFRQTLTGGSPVTNPRAISGSQQLQTFDPLRISPRAASFNSAFYILDAWKPLPHLTVNAGVRLDRENIDTTGFEEFDPRVERRAAIARWAAVCLEVSRQFPTNPNLNCHEASTNPNWRATYDGLPPEGIPRLDIASGVGLRTFRDDNGDGVNDVHPLVAQLDLNGDGYFNPDGNGRGDEGFRIFRDFTFFPDRETSNYSIENTNISPRLAVSWDPWADGRTKLFGTWGRYHDRLFLDTVSGEIGPDQINFLFVPDASTRLIVPGQISRSTSSISINQVARDLRTPFTDEVTLGIERELAPEWSLGLTWIRRRGEDLLQDVDINHVTCPGFATLGIDPMIVCGDAGFLETDRFGRTGVLETSSVGGEVGGDFAFNPAPGAKLPNGANDLYTVNRGFNQILRIGNFNASTYDAWEVKIVRRLHRNWQMQMSYSRSKAFGEAARYADASGNDPETVDDEEGFLDYDQRHVLKFQSVTRLPHEIVLGTSIQWSSGTPWSLRLSTLDVDSTGNTNFRSFFPTGQRNDQRNEGFWKIDARVEKNFHLGRVQASGWVSAENLLDDDHLTLLEVDLTSGDGIPLEAFRDLGRRFEVGATIRF